MAARVLCLPEALFSRKLRLSQFYQYKRAEIVYTSQPYKPALDKGYALGNPLDQVQQMGPEVINESSS